MIVQIDVDRFALLLDEWATAQTYGEDRDGSDDAAFIDANSAVIAACSSTGWWMPAPQQRRSGCL
jgi:hypothetical protein